MNSPRLPKHRQLREDLLHQWKYQRLQKGDKIADQTEMVESTLLEEGYEILYGSFSADTMFQENWKHLDALCLTRMDRRPVGIRNRG